MFKRSQRFSFKNGAPHRKLVGHLFILRFQKSDSPVFGVVCGKVVSKKAVERNRIKRIFLEALSETLGEIDNNYDLVFFLRRPFVEYRKSAIIGELEKSIREVNKI